ncbi:MAG: sensor domain-containing phosphodiesterase [Pseudobutyrivibrio sp.]|nr:sensor domain-containing phosphodiesterase [Pseudobutyrivibrio sp.]
MDVIEKSLVKYVDQTSDGGFWYEYVDGKFTTLDITPKALALFGYNSKEEFFKENKDIQKVMNPLVESSHKDLKYFIEFHENISDERLYVDSVIMPKSGEQRYGTIMICRGDIDTEYKSKGNIFKSIIIIYNENESIFKQSRALLESISSGIVIFKKHSDGRYKLNFLNDGALKIFNATREEVQQNINRDIHDFIYDEDHDVLDECIRESGRCIGNYRATYRVLDSKGKPVWVKCEHKKITIGFDEYLYILFMNISNLMSVQNEMKMTNEKLEEILNATPVGITVYEKVGDEYKLLTINNTLINRINSCNIRLLDEDRPIVIEDFYHLDSSKLIKIVHPDDRDIVQNSVLEVARSGQAEVTFRLDVDKDVVDHDVWIHGNIIRKKGKNYEKIIAAYEEVTKFIMMEEKLKDRQEQILNLIYKDALTGVLNRRSYNEFIARRGTDRFINTGVAFIDLNGLKTINDIYGHAKGDEAIKLAATIAMRFFEADEIYRLSGDNFVIVKENIEQKIFYDKMLKLLDELEKYDLASIGYNWDYEVTELLKNIDKAEQSMRVAKQEYYIHHMDDVSKHRPLHLNDLLNEIKNKRYVVYLQPKAICENTKIVAAEALVRRVEVNGKVVSPEKFVQALEQEKLISYLDFYVLEETCRILQRWNKLGRRDFKISVNMSRITLAVPDYIKKIVAITNQFDIDNKQIEFEITESHEAMDKHFLNTLILKLAKEGYGISLDDMGSEYSSILMLTMKGIDTVKIDRSLVLQMNTDTGLMLINHIINMCHDFGKICIAEGVETDTDRAKLLMLGCDMYQGYLLSPPIAVSKFEELLENN